MDRDMQTILAGRKARLFNETFKRGDTVLHQLTPGGFAQLDRVYGAAFVQGGDSVVELAGRAGVVPTDRLFAPPPEVLPPPLGWARRRTRALALLLAFSLGAALMVLVAISTDPGRHAAAPIGADCDTPLPAEQPATYTQHGVMV